MIKWMKNYPWRLVQTNFREIDMADIDAEQYVRELKEFDATIAMINTAGIIASYPTDLPYHFQSPFLTGDSLGKIIEVCHREGIKVFGRNDFSKIKQSIYEEHPDWAYRKKDGSIVNYNGYVHTCLNGGYQQEYSFKIIEEMLEKLDLDGIYYNMGGYTTVDYDYTYHGLCHCDNCKKRFMDMFGLELPTYPTAKDPVYRKYKVFQDITNKAYHDKMKQVIRNANPAVAIKDVDWIREESSTCRKIPLPYWQYSASSNTRLYRTSYPDLRISNTSVDFVDFPYRNISVNPAQQELRQWQNLANLGGLDYYIMGTLGKHQDKSAHAGIKRVFGFHQKHEDVYANLESVAEILVVRPKGRFGNTEYGGWIRTLTERHFLFDEILENRLFVADLKQYKAIILADAKAINDEDSKRLDDYVENGGILIASGESGCHDAQYEPREQFGFKSMGIKGPVTVNDQMLGATLLIQNADQFQTFKKWGTEVINMGEKVLQCQYSKDSEKLLKLIPPIKFGPPEICYHNEDDVTDSPGVVINRYGQGKAVHIPWWPGLLFATTGYLNASAFMGDLLEDVLGIKRVATNAPPMIEIAVSQKDDLTLLQLVNTSGHFGISFYDPIPMADIWVKIPHDKAVKECISLVRGAKVPFVYENQELTINVDNIDRFESIKII